MATFGNTSISTPATNIYTVEIGIRYTMPENGIVTSMSFYGESVSGKTPVVCLAIYSVTSPYPLLGYTESIDTPTLGWHTLNMISPVNLSAGDYFLTFSVQYEGVTEQTLTVYRGAITALTDGRIFSSDNISGVIPPSNPFYNPTLSNFHTQSSIYATYTPLVAPTANFTATPLYGRAPLTVQFTDTSTNNPTDWTWSFGDGDVSNDQNPAHVYREGGYFTVSLVATNDVGSDTETKTNYIHTLPIANSRFWYRTT